MKKYFKTFSIIVLMFFSFYYTEKIAMYVQNNSPLKKEIINYKNENVVSFVNAEVMGDYIIPGINGLEVNVDKSFNKMRTYNVFSEKYLIYDEVKPEISSLDFKNKIINRGNSLKNGVSILVSKNNTNINYLKEERINFDYIDNKNYCIDLKNNCLKESKKQIVKPTLILSNNNFLRELKKIDKGYLIYLDNNLNREYIYVLIKRIKCNNYNIYTLEEHLSENNHI